MSKKRDEDGDPHFKGATPEALARALLRPINRPSAGQVPTEVEEEVSFMRRKTMLIKNLLHHAVLNGFTARFTTASDMLHELAAQDSDASLARRLRRFTGPQLLAIDEVGYLNYDNRYADLLFEVVTRRYLTVPILLTTNKPFSEWAEVFSSAACVVTLVDRLIHRSEIVQLDGESYRLREAKEQAAKRSKARSRRTAKSRAS